MARSNMYETWYLDRKFCFKLFDKSKFSLNSEFNILYSFDYKKNLLIIIIITAKCVNGIYYPITLPRVVKL